MNMETATKGDVISELERLRSESGRRWVDLEEYLEVDGRAAEVPVCGEAADACDDAIGRVIAAVERDDLDAADIAADEAVGIASGWGDADPEAEISDLVEVWRKVLEAYYQAQEPIRELRAWVDRCRGNMDVTHGVANTVIRLYFGGRTAFFSGWPHEAVAAKAVAFLRAEGML